MTPTRSSSLALLATAATLAGCGGGSKSTTAAKQQAGATTATTATGTTTAPAPTSTTQPPSEQASPPPAMTTTGNGGTEPARTDVELVGRGGKVTPATVNVAPFISVRLTLTSGDGLPYRLSGKGLLLTVNKQRRSASASVPGLRTGASYTLTGSSKVVIGASGEPGP